MSQDHRFEDYYERFIEPREQVTSERAPDFAAVRPKCPQGPTTRVVERTSRVIGRGSATRPSLNSGTRTSSDRKRQELTETDYKRARSGAEVIRPLIKLAKKQCASGRNPRPQLEAVAEKMGPKPPSCAAITQHCVPKNSEGRRHMPLRTEEITRWIISQYLGVGLTRAKQIIARPRRG